MQWQTEEMAKCVFSWPAHLKVAKFSKIGHEMANLATLVSMIPNFWASLAAADLHLCFVIKGNVWWKRIFLPMATIAVLHHKHMKLFKPFTLHVIAWSVREGFNQSIRRTKEQRIAVFSLSDVEICNAIRSYEKRKPLKRKSARIWQCQLKRCD